MYTTQWLCHFIFFYIYCTISSGHFFTWCCRYKSGSLSTFNTRTAQYLAPLLPTCDIVMPHGIRLISACRSANIRNKITKSKILWLMLIIYQCNTLLMVRYVMDIPSRVLLSGMFVSGNIWPTERKERQTYTVINIICSHMNIIKH